MKKQYTGIFTYLIIAILVILSSIGCSDKSSDKEESLAVSTDDTPILTITSDGGGDNAFVAITENQTAVTTITATSPNLLSYSIQAGEDMLMFDINSSTGQLAFKVAPDYETPMDKNKDNKYIVELEAIDTTNAKDRQVLTVFVSDISGATNIFLSKQKVDENSPTQTDICSLSNNGEHTTSTTYTLVDGAGDSNNDMFSIDGAILKTKQLIDYEATNTVNIRINVNDGTNNFSKTFQLNINDIDETPTDIAISSSTVDENLALDTVVGTLSNTDSDISGTYTYTLVDGAGDSNNDMFSIDGAILKTKQLIDYEATNTVNIRINVNDGTNNFSKTFQLNINDIDEISFMIKIQALGKNFTIPTNETTNTYQVDCDSSGVFTDVTGDHVCQYSDDNNYTISIKGDFTSIDFDNSSESHELLEVKQWGSTVWSTMKSAFAYCENLKITATDIPNLTNVKDMSAMFLSAISLDNIPNINKWDTSNITDMHTMFANAQVFNRNIKDWNVSNVTNMDDMFSGAMIFNQDISGWDVSSTIQWSGFRDSSALDDSHTPPKFYIPFMIKIQALGKNFTIPTNETTNTYQVDCDSSGVFTDVTGDHVCQYSDDNNYTISIKGDFTSIDFDNSSESHELLEVKQWGSTVWSTMKSAFAYCENLKITATDIPNLTNVKDMSAMFLSAISLDNIPNINKWDTSNITDMHTMFANAQVFNRNIKDWNVSNVTNMDDMFSGAMIFNQDISGWDVSSTIQWSGFRDSSALNDSHTPSKFK